VFWGGEYVCCAHELKRLLCLSFILSVEDGNVKIKSHFFLSKSCRDGLERETLRGVSGVSVPRHGN
jgi:hypothetical protein